MVLHPIKPGGDLGFGFLREEIERERGGYWEKREVERERENGKEKEEDFCEERDGKLVDERDRGAKQGRRELSVWWLHGVSCFIFHNKKLCFSV